MARLTGLQRPIIALIAIVMAIGLAACGDDDDEGRAGSDARKTEQAFLEAMIPHHELAIEMAEIAQERGRHREIRTLAADIIAAQGEEIAQMERIHERLFGEEITPDPAAHDALGLSADEAGMHEEAAATLERARPFDRAFIDEMIPHHRGAIAMAEVVLAETDDAQIKGLAESITRAQTREIAEMNEWRERWYGAPVPAAEDDETLPPAGDDTGDGSTEEHDAH